MKLTLDVDCIWKLTHSWARTVLWFLKNTYALVFCHRPRSHCEVDVCRYLSLHTAAVSCQSMIMWTLECEESNSMRTLCYTGGNISTLYGWCHLMFTCRTLCFSDQNMWTLCVEGLLVRTLYAGICHSDVHILDDVLELGHLGQYRHSQALGKSVKMFL